MKKYLIVFMTVRLLCLASYGFSQSYDFSDHKIPENWYGQKDHFTISSAGELQLQAPQGSASSYLSWDAPATKNCVWEFYIRYTFAASSTNYGAFYVLSQQKDPAYTGNKGYYLKIGGETGNTDRVELYYQNGTSKTKILESSIGLAGSPTLALRVQLQKHADGRWTLYADPLGGNIFQKEASGVHQNNEVFLYSGLRCIYSSTRRSSFYFDDIRTSEPFTLQSYSFENAGILRLYFTKEINPEGRYDVSIHPFLVFNTSIHGNIIEFQFNKNVDVGWYTVSLKGFNTMNGDTLTESSFVVEKKSFCYTGQLRITESMADPSPSAGLPESEFIEVVNTGKTTVNLSACSIEDPTVRCRLSSYVLPPDSCIILCPKTMCPLFKRSNCMELSCFPNLNNDGDSIRLMINDTLLSDAFFYSVNVLPNDNRRDGGYSIVRTSMPAACIIDQSLSFTTSITGGTPGSTEWLPVNTFISFHTEAISDTVFLIHSNIGGIPEFVPQVWMRNKEKEYNVISFDWIVSLSEPLESGSALTGMIQSVNSCTGESIQIDKPLTFVNPAIAQQGELFINEILYNPLSGGVDFIELFNASDRYLQMHNVYLQHQSSNKNQRISIREKNSIEPFAYGVLTSDTSILFAHYPNAIHSNCQAINPFLSLPDEGGELILMSSTDTLDRMPYGDFLQNPLNREKEGISLEKINPYTSAFHAFNWTSSASMASPGLVNSQYLLSDEHSNKPLYCEPCHVTTDLNGVTDWVLLHLNTNTPFSRGSISIFSLSGEKVLDLFANQLLAPENSFQWNGQRSGNTVLPDGIYIAVAQWWLPDGQKYESRTLISTSAH